MVKMTMKEFECPENQRLVRERLFSVIKTNPISEKELTDKLGIARDTLRRFWKKDKDVDYKTLCVIDSFVSKEETR